MTAPTLIIRIGTDGVTAELGIDASELACWPRDRYMELMDSIGRLNDVVSRPQDYDDGEPRVPLPTSGDLENMVSVATAGTTSGPTAAQLEAEANWNNPEWRSKTAAEMGAVIHEPEVDEPASGGEEPEPPAAPPAPEEPQVKPPETREEPPAAPEPADDLEERVDPEDPAAFGRIPVPHELPAVNLQLIRFLADNHGGFDDDAGFVARELADKLTWTQVVVNDTITACEGLGYVEVDRKGRRIHRVELTEAGRAVAAAHP